MLWHCSQQTSFQGDLPSINFAVFSPYAARKFLEGGVDPMISKFVVATYLTKQLWLIPVTWDGDVIATNKTGNHWTLLVMYQPPNSVAPVFMHIDSLTTNKRVDACTLLIDEIKEHMFSVAYPGCPKDLIASARVFQGPSLKCSQQPGSWECGYYVMYIIEKLASTNGMIFKNLGENTNKINLIYLYKGFDAFTYRSQLAKLSIECNQACVKKLVQNTDDEAVWICGTIIAERNYGDLGIWHRLSIQNGVSRINFWVQLPEVISDSRLFRHK